MDQEYTIVTFNMLSTAPILLRTFQEPEYDASYIDEKRRFSLFDVIFAKWMEARYIICLQEVNTKNAKYLIETCSKYGYQFNLGHSAFPRYEFQTVATLVPNGIRHSVENVKIRDEIARMFPKESLSEERQKSYHETDRENVLQLITIKSGAGEDICQFVNTHFSVCTRDHIKWVSTASILVAHNLLGANRDIPSFLLGDLNIASADDVIGVMERGGRISKTSKWFIDVDLKYPLFKNLHEDDIGFTNNVINTFFNEETVKRPFKDTLDYILARSDSSGYVVEQVKDIYPAEMAGFIADNDDFILPNRFWPSDHLPIAVKLII